MRLPPAGGGFRSEVDPGQNGGSGRGSEEAAAASHYGIVEITPEREYLIVMEFFEGAVEISEADVDDELIDEELLLVRKLWNAGPAHRDVKPGNSWSVTAGCCWSTRS